MKKNSSRLVMSPLSVSVFLMLSVCNGYFVWATSEEGLCQVLKSFRDRSTKQLYSLLNCDSILSPCGTVVSRQKCPFPWVVTVRKKLTREHVCVGSLIDNEHVVTAASCFEKGLSSASLMEIGLGSQHTGYSSYIDIKSLRLHPTFKSKGSTDDVAVVTLRRKVTFSSCLQPICLPGRANYPTTGTTMTVAGWGFSSSYPPSRKLRPTGLESRDIQIVSNGECVFLFPWVQNWENNMCAGHWNQREFICEGYTGAPLMANKEGKWFLQAISSRKNDCDNPSLFTIIPHFVSWIESLL